MLHPASRDHFGTYPSKEMLFILFYCVKYNGKLPSDYKKAVFWERGAFCLADTMGSEAKVYPPLNGGLNRGIMDENQNRVGLTQIFVSFAKIGAVLFGGGYAMLPLLEREVVERRGWCRTEDMSDYYAMAQLVPGVIAVNTSMLIGHHLRGCLGTLAAMLGIILVPFFVLLAYAIAFDYMSELAVLQAAMAGLRPAVAGLMAGVAFTMFNRSRKTPLGLWVALITTFLALVAGIPAVWLIVGGVIAGILWFLSRYVRIFRKCG